jgi:hypothetical protein
MKNKTLIIITSFLAVIICLIIAALLFYKVTPSSLIILSFTIGMVTGVCTAFLILSLTNIIRTKRLKNEQPRS